MGAKAAKADKSSDVDGDSLEHLVCVNVDIIEQLRYGLDSIGQDVFALKPDAETSSIGMHVRHLIEFYQEFLKAVMVKNGTGLCYDNRQRDLSLESDCAAAGAALDDLRRRIQSTVFEDGDLPMSVTLNPPSVDLSTLRTTIHRELYHVFDHSTHHMAIIKLLAKGQGVTLDDNFGMATSTKSYKHTCGDGSANN